MKLSVTVDQLRDAGLSQTDAEGLLSRIEDIPDQSTHDQLWFALTSTILTRDVPFSVHLLLFDAAYTGWHALSGPAPAWRPTAADIDSANITSLCRQRGFKSFAELYEWSCSDRSGFWDTTIQRLGVMFDRQPTATLDLVDGVESPAWLPGARLNIVQSCFASDPGSPAIIFQTEGGDISTVSYGELDSLSNRVACALADGGFAKGDRVAIAMPMTVEAVAAYLGIGKAGGVVVSIADSFSPQEIATRLRISQTDSVVTQDVIDRGGKTIPLYQRVVDAGAGTCIVVPAGRQMSLTLRDGDVSWANFLSDNDDFDAVICDPDDPINILFSSGTTGDPKAIPWNHLTPIKCAMDGHFHQDITPGEVVAWPTNLGWMMGPWLVFASMINRGTMALYYGAPTTAEFCRFVEKAKVQMLGVVPSLVKVWRGTGAANDADWSAIKVFSSTGEASSVEDYLYLMSLAGYRPVIEYCGGTEIGGGYISGTVVQPAAPATFSTPSLGLDLVLLDSDGHESAGGEVYLVPPSIGLSTRLLNRDHHEVYYEGTPRGPNGEALRRHGDEIERIGEYYRALGRADDTMNLGGIKVSSAEIERVVNVISGVVETAAIAITPPGGGPSQLVIYVVREAGSTIDPTELKRSMQFAVSKSLNPLFKIHDVLVIDTLPRTASNKVMRRVLRDQYDK